MQQNLKHAEAREVLDKLGEDNGFHLFVPVPRKIGTRQDVIVFSSLTEGDPPTILFCGLFLTWKDRTGQVKAGDVKRGYNLQVLAISEKAGRFIFKVSDSESGIKELEVSLEELNIDPA